MRLTRIAAAAFAVSTSITAAPALHAEPDLADGWTLEAVTGPSPFHGIHGLTVTPQGRLLAGSVVGATLYEIDRDTGTVTIAEAPPVGMADDVEQGPDGTLAWTAFLQGKVFARTPEDDLLTLAEGLPGTNSIAWREDGRLFMTQVFAGDALWELDPTGKDKPRLIMEGMGGLNGFDFGPDGHLYGPIWFKGQVARVNVDAGTLEVIADGFKTPAAVNFNSKNELFVVDTQVGEVIRVDVPTGKKTLVAQVKPAIDNLAFAPDDTLYISNMADNAIIEVDVETGSSKAVVSGPLAVAADIAMGPDGQTLYVADVFAIRSIDTQTGDVSEIARVFAQEMDYPTSMAVAHGRIAAAGLTAGAVQVLDAATGNSLGLHHGFTTPTDALPLEDGGTLVTEYARGAITRVNPDNWDDRITIVDGLKGPAMLSQGPDSAIYVTETKGGRISRLTDSGGVEKVVDGLTNPEGFTFLADGSIAVAEAGKAQITIVDPASGDRTVVASGLPFGAIPAEGPEVFMPTGIAADESGNLYFSSEYLAQVFRLSRKD
jgi:sugar lactone lactonase YvrE